MAANVDAVAVKADIGFSLNIDARMPRILMNVLKLSGFSWITAFGTSAMMSWMSVTPRSRSSSPLMAVTVTGASIRLSAFRSAVMTTTSD